jgi:GntR family transcriptional repressor for pyruvate dehydrogenase complex
LKEPWEYGITKIASLESQGKDEVRFMFRKIAPARISGDIIEQFKELLGKGLLKPGDELPSERELTELMGVSRPPLREALHALQAMGFLEILPRKRIVVKPVAASAFQDPLGRLIAEDLKKVFELIEIRKSLESWAARKAAERGTQEDIADLERIVQQDSDNLRDNIDDARTDADFHIAIAQATHNTVFSHLMASCYHLLWDALAISREKLFRRRENRPLITEQHRSLLSAIRDRDEDRASREAESHIDFVERELRRILAEENQK